MKPLSKFLGIGCTDNELLVILQTDSHDELVEYLDIKGYNTAFLVAPQNEAEPESDGTSGGSITNGKGISTEFDNSRYEEDKERWEKAICDFMGGGFQLSQDEVMAENIITRWRVLNYLKERNTQYKIDATFDEAEQKRYVKGEIIVIPLRNGKKLLAQGAKGGIWYISPNVWRGFTNKTLVVCICTGNGDSDFKFAESLSDIK
jgi:hypothetical protein